MTTLADQLNTLPRTFNAQAAVDLRTLATCVRWLENREVRISRVSELIRAILEIFVQSATKPPERFTKTEDAIDYLLTHGFSLPSLRNKSGQLVEAILRQIEHEELTFAVSNNELRDAQELIDQAFDVNTSEEGEGA